MVLLDDCAHTITRRLKRLDGEEQCYFGQYRRLAQRILRGVDVEQAYWQTEQEMDAEMNVQILWYSAVSLSLERKMGYGKKNLFKIIPKRESFFLDSHEGKDCRADRRLNA
jgi:hypothetical protein